MSDIVIYTTEDGQNRIQLQAQDGTVWLTQIEIADLFATTKQNVSLHIKNILEDGELSEAATVKETLTVQTEGERKVERQRLAYNLDMILAIGYRVRSKRGVQLLFGAGSLLHQWALRVAKWADTSFDEARKLAGHKADAHIDELIELKKIAEIANKEGKK